MFRSLGSIATILLTRFHTFALKRLLFVFDLPGPCVIESAAGKALRRCAVASEALEWFDVADAAVMGLRRECARRMSADSAPAGMAGSILM
jgi:hypothetical protein